MPAERDLGDRRTRPRPTKPVLGRRPAGAEPVVVRIRPVLPRPRRAGTESAAAVRDRGLPVGVGHRHSVVRAVRPGVARDPSSSGIARRSSGDARPTPMRRPLLHAGFGRARVGGTDPPAGRLRHGDACCLAARRHPRLPR
ncbi:hypothetical protein Ae406Ps2_3817 [Pseudonocardia sp. Ae406_Ps2]|nr:hypothetical protein Ae331Ps2_2124c [Pseudonocardia sp. Ae331_Ps2]OLM03817.1 hypothetical protein Ae406Ps2_3817 [Pseudonocardia sp. Ae406_Ps2]OLM25374.1 hypothetical protein Ae706Ps2_3807 [Pseudonocardia sp. Ae706_Ps2]